MWMPHQPVLAMYALIIMWVVFFAYAYRKKIPAMIGMMISMSLGMVTGLGAGIIMGMLLNQQFFHASLASMMIGASVGAIAGFPNGLMAVLDGLLSGIMGGMMGVMFIFMIPSEYWIVTVKIAAVITSGIIFLLFLTVQNEVNLKEKDWKMQLFGKPHSFFIVICLFLLMMNWVAIPISQTEKSHSFSASRTTTYQLHNQPIPLEVHDLKASAANY